MIAFLLRRPLLWWLSYGLAVSAIVVVARQLMPNLHAGPSGLSGAQVAVQALITLVPLLFAHRLGWRAVGAIRPRRLHLVVFPAATVGFAYLAGFRPVPVSTVVLAAVLVVLVAVGEEVAFRGVLLTLLLQRFTLWKAVALASMAFGLMHLVNLLGGAALPGVLLQVLFASLGAAGFVALRLCTGSLWPGMVLHAFYDLAFRVVALEPGSLFADAVYTLHGVGLLIFAVIVLRRGRPSPSSAVASEAADPVANSPATNGRRKPASFADGVRPAAGTGNRIQ